MKKPQVGSCGGGAYHTSRLTFFDSLTNPRAFCSQPDRPNCSEPDTRGLNPPLRAEGGMQLRHQLYGTFALTGTFFEQHLLEPWPGLDLWRTAFLAAFVVVVMSEMAGENYQASWGFALAMTFFGPAILTAILFMDRKSTSELIVREMTIVDIFSDDPMLALVRSTTAFAWGLCFGSVMIPPLWRRGMATFNFVSLILLSNILSTIRLEHRDNNFFWWFTTHSMAPLMVGFLAGELMGTAQGFAAHLNVPGWTRKRRSRVEAAVAPTPPASPPPPEDANLRASFIATPFGRWFTAHMHAEATAHEGAGATEQAALLEEPCDMQAVPYPSGASAPGPDEAAFTAMETVVVAEATSADPLDASPTIHTPARAPPARAPPARAPPAVPPSNAPASIVLPPSSAPALIVPPPDDSTLGAAEVPPHSVALAVGKALGAPASPWVASNRWAALTSQGDEVSDSGEESSDSGEEPSDSEAAERLASPEVPIDGRCAHAMDGADGTEGTDERDGADGADTRRSHKRHSRKRGSRKRSAGKLRSAQAKQAQRQEDGLLLQAAASSASSTSSSFSTTRADMRPTPSASEGAPALCDARGGLGSAPGAAPGAASGAAPGAAPGVPPGALAPRAASGGSGAPRAQAGALDTLSGAPSLHGALPPSDGGGSSFVDALSSDEADAVIEAMHCIIDAYFESVQSGQTGWREAATEGAADEGAADEGAADEGGSRCKPAVAARAADAPRGAVG